MFPHQDTTTPRSQESAAGSTENETSRASSSRTSRSPEARHAYSFRRSHSPEIRSQQNSTSLVSHTPRNPRVSRTASPTMSSAGPSTPADRWKCPYCKYIQQTHRMPDLRRHIATHERDPDVPQWICCGVPLAEAAKLGVPEAVRNGEVFKFNGTLMVGGCRWTFSRRDALKRHLKHEKGKCFGDPMSPYQPGNMPDSDDD